jgi:uncharacterized membrane protein SirB2
MVRLLVVFIHVCAAMGIFGAGAIEGASLLQLHRLGGKPTALDGFGLAQRLGSISFALILLSGIFLTQTTWGWEAAWIRVSMFGLIAMIAIGATVTRRAMARLRVTPDAPGGDSALTRSFLMRLAILVGIVFLMTVKPPLMESLTAMGIAAGAGFLAGLPSGRRRATQTA